ncbi:MAG: hypothetical protein JW769_03015 [Parachlamydiales bacterium]|nr:hypothetical protein [Parachlamydiales bacterium]
MSRRFLPLLLFLIVNINISGYTEESSKEFRPFTGKISANKVRIRLEPNLESFVIRTGNKNDLILIVGEQENFWAIKPPQDVKAYIYRTYILDGVIEANRVNIRLSPNNEAPIIGKLSQGEKIQGSILEENPKWLEIEPPNNVSFYISKDYVTFAGDDKYIIKMEKRNKKASDILNDAFFLAEKECKKPFNEMDPNAAIAKFEKIIQKYFDFPDYVKQAKEGLALLQDTYLQKKIVYLEKASDKKVGEKEKMAALAPVNKEISPTDKMCFWQPVEEAIYQAWNTFNPEKSKNDFYQEQEVQSLALEGIVENYNVDVKGKPGDYILRKNNVPIAYLYSTKIDLEKYQGKKVTLLLSPRPNNNFAFPAYYVNAIK